jgi:glycosyltransferase involved in cell wall biosynthesis
VFIAVSGKIDLVNRIAHTAKLATILGRFFPEVTIILEDVSPNMQTYMNSCLCRSDRVNCICVGAKRRMFRSVAGAIPLVMVRDLLASFAIAIETIGARRRYVDRDRLVIIKGFNVSLILLLKLLRYRVMLFAGGLGSTACTGLEKYWVLAKEIVACTILDRIIVETPSVLRNCRGLRKFERKFFSQGALYVKDEFRVVKPLHARKPIIGYVGALIREKNVAKVVEAMHVMAQVDEDARLYVIGDGPLKPCLESIAGELLTKRVVRLLGRVSDDEIPRYLNEMKLLVLPSTIEGLPNVVIEAMACGTPVLATRVGGIVDVIEDSASGFLLESLEADGLASRILSLIHNEDALEIVAANALRIVSERFTLRAATERYRSLLVDDAITE